MSYTQCPRCERRFTPPGPCQHIDPDTGQVCGYELDPPPPLRRKRAVVGQVAMPDRDALARLDDDQVDTHRTGIADARRALAEAEFRKQLPAGHRALAGVRGAR